MAPYTTKMLRKINPSRDPNATDSQITLEISEEDRLYAGSLVARSGMFFYSHDIGEAKKGFKRVASDLRSKVESLANLQGSNYALRFIQAYLSVPVASSRIHSAGERINPRTLRVTSRDPNAIRKGIVTKALEYTEFYLAHKPEIDELKNLSSSPKDLNNRI